MAASAVRWLGRRHEARRSRLFLWARRCAPGPGRVSSAGRFAALAVVVGLAALGRKAFTVVCARFTPAACCPRACVVNKEAGALWFRCLRFGRRARAAGVALSSCPPGFVVAVSAVGLGVFFPEALAPGKARASGRFVRRGPCHGPCFSALAKPRLALPRPAP